MEQQSLSDEDMSGGVGVIREYETSPEYLRDVLKHVVEIGASLRLKMDKATLLTRIVATACKALRFRYAVLYLSDGAGFFRVAATNGINTVDETYLQEHPVPDSIVARIIDQRYRMSDSYFLSAEAVIWQDEVFSSYFRVIDATDGQEPVIPPVARTGVHVPWSEDDLMVVPLVSGDEHLLGFLTPDAPLNGLRPNRETLTVLELFANQAAVAIEGERLYGELREAVRQARESERVKNNFLMAASHELRTPLTAVQGYLELLGDYGETLDHESRVRFIQNARRGCDELVLLLGNVLDATHLDVEKINFQPASVDLGQSAQLILEILEPIVAREKRRIEIHVPSGLRVWIDELRLRQILLNLLGNALKYTPAGSRIVINAECVDATHFQQQFAGYSGEQCLVEPASGIFVILAIRDWGPGVSPEEQNQLFTKFTRLTSARNSSQPGAGLGLYLCRQLIQSMGGIIWMESSGIAGEGATFFVALPKYAE